MSSSLQKYITFALSVRHVVFPGDTGSWTKKTQSINQPLNKSINQSINQLTNRGINWSIKQLIDREINQQITPFQTHLS